MAFRVDTDLATVKPAVNWGTFGVSDWPIVWSLGSLERSWLKVLCKTEKEKLLVNSRGKRKILVFRADTWTFAESVWAHSFVFLNISTCAVCSGTVISVLHAVLFVCLFVCLPPFMRENVSYVSVSSPHCGLLLLSKDVWLELTPCLCNILPWSCLHHPHDGFVKNTLLSTQKLELKWLKNTQQDKTSKCTQVAFKPTSNSSTPVSLIHILVSAVWTPRFYWGR